MGLLSDELVALAAIQTDEVKIGSKTYRVRECSVADCAEYGKHQHTSRETAAAGLLVAGVIDETGEPVLTMEDAQKIVKSARVCLPLVNRILEISGLSEKEGAAEKKA